MNAVSGSPAVCTLTLAKQAILVLSTMRLKNLFLWSLSDPSCVLREVMQGMLLDSGFPLYSNWPTPKPTNQA